MPAPTPTTTHQPPDLTPLVAGGPSFSDYDRHFQRIGNVAPDWQAAERNPARHASRKPWLPAGRGARILDFGCGWGHQLLALWCAGYRNLEGVELSAEQARVARDGVAGRFDVHCADGRAFLETRPARYDLVVLNDVIEHVPTTETVPLLRAIFRGLRPGGRIVVRTPNMASLLAGYSRYMDVTHVTGFTEFSLVQVLEQAGFRDVRYVSDFELNWHLWRPWTPLDHIGLRAAANFLVHKALYVVRGQRPHPTRFGMNLEAYADAPPA